MLAAFGRQIDGLDDVSAVAPLLHASLAALLDVDAFAAFAAVEPRGVLSPRYMSCAPHDGTGAALLDAATRCAAGLGSVVERISAGRPGAEQPFVITCVLASATVSPAIVCATLVAAPDQDDILLLTSLCDIAALSLDRHRDARTGRLLTEILDRSDESVSLYDADGALLFSNQAYHRIFDHYPDATTLRGFTHEALYRLDLQAGVIDEPLAKSDPDQYLADRAHVFRTLTSDLRESQTIKGRGYLYTRTRLASGETLSRRTDITEMKDVETRLRSSQQRLEEIAYIDMTTGLSNRTRFRELVDGEVVGGTQPMAIVLINLDRFKAINEGLGDAAGDAVLSMVAERLRSCVWTGDLLARLGGDEFAIRCVVKPGSNVAMRLVDRVLAAFREPFVVGGRRMVISVSVGVSSYPDHGDSADTLLQHARLALQAAKEAGGQRCRHFDAPMRAALIDRKMLALDLRDAVALGQLELHYQPLTAIRGRIVEGFEALVRWRHPTRGMVSPAEFIPLAEETGLITAIGNWVLRQAMSDSKHLPLGSTMAVNLSPRQIAQSDIVETAVGMAQEQSFDLSRLELEITESHVLHDDRTGIETLRQLRRLGVGISLDDFGTGYSSLSYLLSFPFTKIKIDKSFVGAMVHRSDAAAIVTAVVSLADRLRMVVTAEGVETPEQLQRLHGIGCHQVQGYLIARPLPLEELRHWLATRGAAHAAEARPQPDCREAAPVENLPSSVH